jgi:hypothetical protein
MGELYVEPPQLTVAVYGNAPERETFAQLCSVLPAAGCSPDYLLEVAPADIDFEMISDLGANRDMITVDSGRYERLLAGQEPDLRVLQARYSHRKYGHAVVGYEMRKGTGAHPVGASVSAGALGFPDSLWSAKQRREAYALADWSRSLLETAAAACKPLYGAVGIEYSLPTPSKLADTRAGIPTEWFISRDVLNQASSLEGKLRALYTEGAVTEWADGIFCSGWEPYNSERKTVGQPSETARSTARTLGRTLSGLGYA